MSIRNISMFIGCMCVTSSIGVADIWFDPTGDIATGNPNLDITSFEITDNGSDLLMTIEVADLTDTWGNYMIFLDAPGLESIFEPGEYSGSGDNDNPWGRNVSGLAGTDFFLGGGVWGANAYEYFWGSWNGPFSGGVEASLSFEDNTISFVYSDFVAVLGGVYGLEGVNFEVGTTGGNWGAPAIDLLNGTGGNWGEGSTGAWEYYQFSTVPAPGALVLLTIAGFSRKRRV